MTIRNRTRNTALAHAARLADDPLSRMKGLLGRSGLNAGEALVITSCNSVHMLFMKFSLDVVFLDRDGRVVGLCEDLKPFRLSPVFFKSACAIELAAGTIKATQTQMGDRIEYGRNV